MTTVTAPLTTITLAALVPDVVRSCVVLQPSPPPDPGEEPPAPVTGNDIYTPIAPGVTYANLPVAPTIVDTSPVQMIGCIVTVADNPQGRLNALFPSAISGDGVIDRATNDIWVYDGATWNNVGPTPGPTITATVVIPPWNETLLAVARTRTKLSVNALAYALELLTEPDPIVTKTKLRVQRVMPAAKLTLAAHSPAYVGEQASVIQPPLSEFVFSAFLPEVQTGDPFIIFSMDGSDGATAVTSIDTNAIAATFNGNAQLDTAIKKYGTASLQLSGPATFDFVEFEAFAPLGSDDFTVEFWVYIPSSVAIYSTVAMFSDLYSVDYDPDVSQLALYPDGGPAIYSTRTSVPTDQFFHVAVYRISGDFYLALDGEVWTETLTDSHSFADTTHRLGDWDGSGDFGCACHIDDYRLSIGTAVYSSSDFTPPAAPFS